MSFWWWIPRGDQAKKFELGVAALIMFALLGAFLAKILAGFFQGFTTAWYDTVRMTMNTANQTLANVSTVYFLDLSEAQKVGLGMIKYLSSLISNPTALLVLMALSLLVYLIMTGRAETR